jgi:hypothetical protein
LVPDGFAALEVGFALAHETFHSCHLPDQRRKAAIARLVGLLDGANIHPALPFEHQQVVLERFRLTNVCPRQIVCRSVVDAGRPLRE